MTVRIRRAYEPPTADDGIRYLIDRVWPRGVSRGSLRLTGWLKEIAPSDELRRWFAHDPDRYPEFRRRYRAELDRQEPLVHRLVEEARDGTVTLVFGARDVEHSNATVLLGVLEDRLATTESPGPARERGPTPRPNPRS